MNRWKVFLVVVGVVMGMSGEAQAVQATYHHSVLYGQSLSVGSHTYDEDYEGNPWDNDAITSLTTNPGDDPTENNSYMFTEYEDDVNDLCGSGIRLSEDPGNSLISANLTDFSYLHDDLSTTHCNDFLPNHLWINGQTVGTPVAWMLHSLLGYHRMMVTENGWGGKKISELSQGTVPYINIKTTVQAAKDVAAGEGAEGNLNHVWAVFFTQGEADQNKDETPTSRESYKNALATLRTNLNTDLLAITQQANQGGPTAIKMIVSQLSDWFKNEPTVPLAQLDAHKMGWPNDKVYVACPKYFLNYRPRPDGVSREPHLSAQSTVLLGEYYAKAYYRWIFNAGTYDTKAKVGMAIHPESAILLTSGGNRTVNINLNFYGCLPASGRALVFDNDSNNANHNTYGDKFRPSDPTATIDGVYNYRGLEFVGSTNDAKISSAYVMASGKQVRVVLDKVPEGNTDDMFVRYAYSNPSVETENPGRTTGPRGLLRDNDTDVESNYFPDFKLYNWALTFKQEVTLQ